MHRTQPTLDRTAPAPPTDGPLRVVMIDEELPYPPTSGKRIRTLNLTMRLARRAATGGPVALRMDALRRRSARPGPGAAPGHGPQRRVGHLAALPRDRDESAQALVHRTAVAEVSALRALRGGRDGTDRRGQRH